jgi:hypothetical protein
MRFRYDITPSPSECYLPSLILGTSCWCYRDIGAELPTRPPALPGGWARAAAAAGVASCIGGRLWASCQSVLAAGDQVDWSAGSWSNWSWCSLAASDRFQSGLAPSNRFWSGLAPSDPATRVDGLRMDATIGSLAINSNEIQLGGSDREFASRWTWCWVEMIQMIDSKSKLFPTSGRGIIVHFVVLGVVGESVSAYICYSVSFCW